MRARFHDVRGDTASRDAVRKAEGLWLFCDGAMITSPGYTGSRSILGVTSALVRVVDGNIKEASRHSCLTRISIAAKIGVPQEKFTILDAQKEGLKYMPPITATNNDAEALGMLSALRFAARSDGLVNIACDSEVTLKRLYKALEVNAPWYQQNITSLYMSMSSRDLASNFCFMAKKIERTASIKLNVYLLSGHPTKSELSLGSDQKSGLPVSRFNVEADTLATSYAVILKEKDWMKSAMGVTAQ